MPKFRGGSDDWLDDQKSKHGSKKKGAPKAGAPLSREEANATVAEVFPKQCRVKLDAGGVRLCSYRRANVMAPHPEGIRERAPVAVGDRVKVSSTDPQSGVIEAVCERTNILARPAPDRDEGMIHVLATNIEALVVVASSKNPEFSPGLVDRFLVAAEHAGIRPMICITKRDLITKEAAHEWEHYSKLGYECVEVSVSPPFGIEELRAALAGKQVVFCGHSGVGKTSLINALVGTAVGRVGITSDSTGKGRHTTTSAVLIDAYESSAWIDTPGVREFGLWGITPETLGRNFPEFRALPWVIEERQPNEEELADLEALTTAARAGSYRRILQSLIEGEN